jgi:hypothetical protein
MPNTACLDGEIDLPVFGIGPAQRLTGAASNLGADDGMPSALDRAFIVLQDAYRPHGGLSRLHSLVAAGRVPAEGRDGGAAPFGEACPLFGFRWHLDFWLPMFQFEIPGPSVAAGPQRVVAEWGGGFDGWALARWFVRPNIRLQGCSPVECLAARLPDVLEAAHADRQAAIG